MYIISPHFHYFISKLSFGKEFVKKCHEKIRRIMMTTDGNFPEKSDFVV